MKTSDTHPDFKIAPLTATLGAEIKGLSLADASPEQSKAIRAALLEHHVLVFRDQALDELGHLAFARSIAEIQPPPVPTRHGGSPEINVLDQTQPKGDGADLWHNDNTYLECPPMGSVLRAVMIPSVGGDTCFANMFAAYDALSAPIREMIDDLDAVHDLTNQLRKAVGRGNSTLDIEATRKRFPPVVHPLVRVHPESGRKALFANSNATVSIVGLTRAESDLLLRLLFEHVYSPAFQCRVRWQVDTVVLFDNRCVQHFAVPDYHDRRIMHRITLAGDRPFGPRG